MVAQQSYPQVALLKQCRGLGRLFWTERRSLEQVVERCVPDRDQE
jgi:hypothetical protein